MNSQLISVIIPVYNVAPYVARCVNSILHQSHIDMEIVLVDDGSTDGSGGIVDKFAERHKNIVAIHQENKGVSAARNAGLRMATGAYIGFVDPDDYIDRNMYHDLYLKLIKNDADIAACCWQDEFETNDCITVQYAVDGVFSGEKAIEYDLSHGMFITCNKLFSRKACHDIFYDESVINGEDRLFDIMALLRAKRVVYVNKPYYHYYHRSNSAGTKKYTPRDKSLLDVCVKIKELVSGRGEVLQLLADAQLLLAYVQLLRMMKFNIHVYRSDGGYILGEMRKQIWRMLTNRYLKPMFKLKFLIICVSPRIMLVLSRLKKRLI